MSSDHFLVVRYGPAPTDTVGGDEKLHSTFTGFFQIAMTLAEVASLGEIRENGVDAMHQVAVGVWRDVLKEGNGHILIGRCSGFEYVDAGGAGGCGATSYGVSAQGAPFAPKDYKALFAIARYYHVDPDSGAREGYVDISVDYRKPGATPGDPSTLEPRVFVLPEEGAGAENTS